MIVARYGGTPELAARVEEAVRTQQNNDTAVAIGQAAASILERVVVQVRAGLGGAAMQRKEKNMPPWAAQVGWRTGALWAARRAWAKEAPRSCLGWDPGSILARCHLEGGCVLHATPPPLLGWWLGSWS